MMINLCSAVAHWARCDPNRICLEQGDFITTYRELDRLAQHICNIIKNTDEHLIIAISFANQYYFLGCVVACMRQNRLFALLDINDPDPYCRSLIESEKGFIVFTDSKDEKIFTTTTIRFPIELDKQRDAEVSPGKVGSVSPYAPSGILFTSGTTGLPVGLIRTNYSLLSEAVLWMIELQLHQHCIFAIGRPLFWTASFVFSYATLLCGGTIRVDEHDDELALVSSNRMVCHIAFFTPTQLERIHHSGMVAKKFATTVLTMGSPISPTLKIEFSKSFDCELVESWGTSEGLGTITRPDDVLNSPETIGRACFCDHVIVVSKDLEDLGVNKQGILAGWSDNQFDLTLSKDNKISPDLGITRHRMLVSGDIGIVDERGLYKIFGRAADQIIYNEISLFPSEIEKHINSLDGICDCAFCVLSDSKGPQRAVLLIQTQKQISISSCLGNISQVLESFLRRPSGFDCFSVEGIPRNRNGKIIRELVTQIAESKLRENNESC